MPTQYHGILVSCRQISKSSLIELGYCSVPGASGRFSFSLTIGDAVAAVPEVKVPADPPPVRELLEKAEGDDVFGDALVRPDPVAT